MGRLGLKGGDLIWAVVELSISPFPNKYLYITVASVPVVGEVMLSGCPCKVWEVTDNM